ncbi:MAG: DNA repair protein RecN [Firmicutes bacterium]|nr:DNA repair protein RecN [Bacillota bacterium]
MLSKLSIQNVALIRSLELDFCGRLNILSGETGAGKSIIVDSLLLLLGGKFDKTILRFGAEEGLVEGVFESDARISAALEACGFDPDDIIIARRKFSASGKNEIRVNGRAATAGMLQSLTEKLVDIYGQNEYQSLAKSQEHLKILDFALRAEMGAPLKRYGEIYRELQRVSREIKNIGDASERARNADIIKFQLNEIKKAHVCEGEEEELLERRRIVSSAEKIATALSGAASALSEAEPSAAALVDDAMYALRPVSSLSNRFESLYERLSSVSIELSDIAGTCAQELGAVEFDEGELEKLENRLDVIRSLKRKYGDYAAMQAFYKRNAELLEAMANGAYLFEKLQNEREKLLDEAYALALTLSGIRKEGAKRFEAQLIKEIADLGMPGAQVCVEFNEFPSRTDFENHFSPDGADRPEFYFSANRGMPAKPLAKIISGGELSRFMLALKTVSSDADDMPTMIFDEIDVGIGGKTGQEVAKKLAVIARSRQVLCVTHLPTIAAMADLHFFIEKVTLADDTVTTVRTLDEAGEIEEISRLSGAKDISAQSAENARQMKQWSRDFKSI